MSYHFGDDEKIPDSNTPTTNSTFGVTATTSQKVHDLKGEVKYLLERQRLINRDIYEYDAHKKTGIDFRYDAVTICRCLLGDENASTLNMTSFIGLNHRLDFLRFPQREIVDTAAIQSYLSSIFSFKREISSLLIGLSMRPVEILISADPIDVLVGETHVILTFLLSSSHVGDGDDQTLLQSPLLILIVQSFVNSTSQCSSSCLRSTLQHSYSPCSLLTMLRIDHSTRVQLLPPDLLRGEEKEERERH
jgi:hypothetical protein